MSRIAPVIILKDKTVLIGYGRQHRDIIIENNISRDEDIIGYYDLHDRDIFVPNRNYYLYNEELCEIAIEEYLERGGIKWK